MKKIKDKKMKTNAIYGSLARKAQFDALKKRFYEYMTMGFYEYMAMEYTIARAQMARELYEQFQDMTKEEILEFLGEWDAWEN